MLLWDPATEVVLGRRDGCKEDLLDVFYNSPVVWVGSLIIAISEVLICCLQMLRHDLLAVGTIYLP
jgi:hypothetical protein